MMLEVFFDMANTHLKNELPFVLYSKPNAPTVKGLFQKNATIYTSEHLTESGFIFSPFSSKEQTILMPLKSSQQIEAKLLHLKKKTKTKTVKHVTTVAKAKTTHTNLVRNAIQTITSSSLKKVIVSRLEIVSLLETNPIELFKRLLPFYPKAFVYCWYHPKIGLWLGATPENFLSTTGNHFKTMSLAGTQEYKGDDNPIWKNKEIEEQQLVTNFVTKRLKSLTNNLTIGATKTIKAGHLLHLQTIISGKLNSNLKDIVYALHPTPAVCGLPKTIAKRFIASRENYKREYYTGFLGELNIKEKTDRNTNRSNVENNAYLSIKTVSNLYVNLRCMQLKGTNAYIYVGGGITKDSNPEKEWEETVNKAETMKKILF